MSGSTIKIYVFHAVSPISEQQGTGNLLLLLTCLLCQLYGVYYRLGQVPNITAILLEQRFLQAECPVNRVEALKGEWQSTKLMKR